MAKAKVKKSTTTAVSNVLMAIPADNLNAVEKSNSWYIPTIDPNYIQWGNYEDVKRIIESRNFFPTWITGLSGNGKTMMIKQACAETGREFVRFNFTIETDENDLLGSQKLIEQNGTTISVWEDGPVTKAMRRGAVLLLDEVSVGHTNKILCLQSILEGEGVLLNTNNEYVRPSPGFQIFATSNDKGRGSENGKFIGTQLMNDAFLDRFAAMMFQDYPSEKIEEQILSNYFIDFMWLSKGVLLEDIPTADAAVGAKFVETLCKWSMQIRESYKNTAVNEVITTRSLINIVKAFAIFGDKEKAIRLACERYPDETRDQFIQIYSKLEA